MVTTVDGCLLFDYNYIVLGGYSKFINNLEEEYYEFLYENYLKLVDEEL